MGELIDLDGVYTCGGASGTGPDCYSAVLRNGCIEVVRWFRESGQWIPNPGLEELLLGEYAKAIGWLPLVAMDPPAMIAVSLLGVKGRTLFSAPFEEMRAVRQEDILAHDVLDPKCEPINCGAVLRPVCDAIWQACGKLRSGNFTEAGEWHPIRRVS